MNYKLYMYVFDKISKQLDQGGAVDMVYLDFAKAFDTAPHKRLIKKLEGYGVTGNLLEWIREFLDGRKQWMIVEVFSGWARVFSGGISDGINSV